MSRFTRFSRGKIWLVDIGLCKRFDIFQLWIYFAKYSAAAGAGGAWSQCLATAQCHLGFPTLSLCKRYKCNNQIEEKYLTKRRLADEDNGRRCKRGEVITREPGGGISWENLSVFTRQPHLPSTPAPASPSDLKAHLLWPGGSCECFFDLVNDDFEVKIVKAMRKQKKSFLQATKQL